MWSTKASVNITPVSLPTTLPPSHSTHTPSTPGSASSLQIGAGGTGGSRDMLADRKRLPDGMSCQPVPGDVASIGLSERANRGLGTLTGEAPPSTAARIESVCAFNSSVPVTTSEATRFLSRKVMTVVAPSPKGDVSVMA